MGQLGIPTHPASTRRRLAFSLVGGLVALALMTATPNVLSPWRTINVEGLTDPAHARWSLALEGSVDLLALLCLVAALARPARSALLAQYLFAAAVLAAVTIVPFTGPTFLVTAGLILLAPLTYPYPRELVGLRSQPGPSMMLLAVAVAAAAVLMPLALRDLRTQASLPRGSEADLNILATNAEHLLLLALAGLLAATRRPGWQVIALAVATVYSYLALATFLLPHQPNTWGLLGGIAALLTAAGFGIATAVAALGRHGVTDSPTRLGSNDLA